MGMSTFSTGLGREVEGREGVAAVCLERVSRVFGNFVALREVSLEVGVGESVVLLGENGAGKSTLLRVVAGLMAPSFGTVEVFGEKPQEMRGKVAYMSHASMLYDELTAVENLRYFAGLYTVDDGGGTVLKERAAEALQEVGLDPGNERRVGEYSQGMRQRAALARVLMTEPELLLLDEPFSNLDVGSAERMVERLLGFCAGGSSGVRRTVILTTHQAGLARPLAGVTVVLKGGRVESVVRRDE
jgi:ABC-type multidrug transport system ATPase subunit